MAWNFLKRKSTAPIVVIGVAFEANAIIANVEFQRNYGDMIWRGLPLIFVPVGVLHATILNYVGRNADNPAYQNMARLFGFCLIGLVAMDAAFFLINGNAMRGFPGQLRLEREIEGAALSIPGVRGIQFYTKMAHAGAESGGGSVTIDEEEVRETLRGWKEIVTLIRQAENPVELIGVMTTFYALASKKPLQPVTSNYSPLYTGPPVNSNLYADVRRKMLANLTKQQLSAVVIANGLLKMKSELNQPNLLADKSCDIIRRIEYTIDRPCSVLNEKAGQYLLGLREGR